MFQNSALESIATAVTVATAAKTTTIQKTAPTLTPIVTQVKQRIFPKLQIVEGTSNQNQALWMSLLPLFQIARNRRKKRAIPWLELGPIMVSI